MPKAMEKHLKDAARKKFGTTTSERAKAYIYGRMRDTGWTPSHQRKKIAKTISKRKKKGK